MFIRHMCKTKVEVVNMVVRLHGARKKHGKIQLHTPSSSQIVRRDASSLRSFPVRWKRLKPANLYH